MYVGGVLPISNETNSVSVFRTSDWRKVVSHMNRLPFGTSRPRHVRISPMDTTHTQAPWRVIGCVIGGMWRPYVSKRKNGGIP